MAPVQDGVSEDMYAVEGDTGEYREISPRAVLGLCLGAASWFALVHVAFWFLPLLAALMSISALLQIRRQTPQLRGRLAALAGLAFSLIFGISAPLVFLGKHYEDRLQAGVVAQKWFMALRENKPDAAIELALPPWQRTKQGDSVPSRYAGWDKTTLDKYIKRPDVHALLCLGKRARIRYCGQRWLEEPGEDFKNLESIYAVTVDDAGGRSSFFIKLKLRGAYDRIPHVWNWHVFQDEIMSEWPDEAGRPSSTEGA
jgi:hypothetical protein